MKRTLSFLLAFFLITAGLYAFPYSADKLKEAGLNDQEIKKVEEIYLKYQNEKKKATAELNIIKAKIDKELIADNVNMTEVEKLMRESLEWKLKIEMANIQKRIELKKLLGENRLQKLRWIFIEERRGREADKKNIRKPRYK